MGYPSFGKVKTIVLPIDAIDGEMTIEQYKEKYGIDLKDLIYLDELNKTILLKNKDNLLILVNDMSSNSYLPIFCPPSISVQAWEEGNSNGNISFLDNSNDFGVIIEISQDDNFKIENVKVYQSGI